MKLNHIGYITDSLSNTVEVFTSMGYQPTSIVEFPAHKCRLCFVKKMGEIPIEIVEPYEDNKSLRRLSHNGVFPYHLCYEVDNIQMKCEEFRNSGFIALSSPVSAPAFNNRLICYLWSRNLGYIELLDGSRISD